MPNVGNAMAGCTSEKDGFTPFYRGIFDDKGRLMVVINANTDLGDAWEWAEVPEYPLKYSTFAYQMGVNFIVYCDEPLTGSPMGPLFESVFEFLFKYRPFLFEKGRFVMASPWPAAVVLALGAAAVVLELHAGARVGAPRRTADPARRRAHGGPGPGRSSPSAGRGSSSPPSVPQQSFVGVLVDDSRSMRIADDGEPRGAVAARVVRAATAALLGAPRRALQAAPVPVLGDGRAPAQRRPTSPSTAGRRRSRARWSGRGQELSAVPLAGLVLVTDGADNGRGRHRRPASPPARPLRPRLHRRPRAASASTRTSS